MVPRRQVMTGAAAAGLALPFLAGGRAGATGPTGDGQPVIRTITAFAALRSADDHDTLGAVSAFLTDCKSRFEAAGARVQTLRLATQPLARFHRDWRSDRGLARLIALDREADRAGVSLALGPLLEEDSAEATLPGALAALYSETSRLNAAIPVTGPDGRLRPNATATAARTIVALSTIDPKGAGNFRFAAMARCEPGIPFFPAAWHDGTDRAFAIGFESPNLFLAHSERTEDPASMQRRTIAALTEIFAPLDALGQRIATKSDWRWLGIDSSPAPGLDASIGAVLEALSGVPFGEPGTLRACRYMTDMLKTLPVRLTGFSGLMLPTLEDPVLARRAAEGRFGLASLLLYSSVCGTGLDVAPLPGETTIETLSHIIGDVATLATKLDKPLVARLLPIPGRRAGEPVDFDHPLLTASRVMAAQ
ncbi:MAG: PFL family protein [Rhodothalassiaceae bacterium]